MNNNNWTQLDAVRKQFVEATDALSKSPETSAQFLRASQRLFRFDDLIQQLKNLVNEQSHELVRDPAIQAGPTQRNMDRLESSESESDKARGARIRANWVSAHFGTTLTKTKGALYRNSHGETVGIAYAQEKAYRKARWFAGLPTGKFDCVAILCEPIQGELFAICLPTTFIRQHLPQFSKSNIGQVKFNVLKRGDNFFLDIPNVGNVDVTKHRNNFSLLS